MTDKDNMLLEGFFKAAAQQQIEDNGFTERVMTVLDEPMRANRKFMLYTHLWTAFCVVVAAVLFFLLNGMESLTRSVLTHLHTLLTWFCVFVRTAPTAEIHVDPLVILFVAVLVLIVLPYQIARKLFAIL